MRGARRPPERAPGAVSAETRVRYKRPVSVLVVVHTRAGEVLLLERRVPPGYWQSVTGSLRWNEAPAAAA
ncbi:MAG: NUDIX domain-containing protein, partial [Gammaproteobacteria bacterium]|nr:NUDIX domain-containing protein [Gammaproteobacteria bacterium]